MKEIFFFLIRNYFLFCFSHFAKVYFGLDKTVIATAHGSTAFEAKSKAADRAMIALSNRTKQSEVNFDFENFSNLLI